MADLTIDSAFRGKFMSEAVVTNLISTRLYPRGNVPQVPTKPYATYQRITTDNNHHMSAASGLQVVDFQIDCVCETYPEVIALADAFRNATDGFRGTVTIGLDSLTLRQCHLDNQTDAPINPTDGGETGTFVINQDWSVGAVIAAPTL